MPVYKRKLERRRESKCCDIYELHSLISATALQLAPLGLRQSGSCWRSVIHTRRNTKISSNVPISFYIRAWGIACALTRLDFLSTTSSAGEEWREHSGCWRIQQRCVPFLRECSFAALLGFLGWGWANMSTEKWCIYDNLKH